MRHRDDIEGIRAVAVIAVVLYHVGVPGCSGGYVGVDVFFVISGFLITSLLLDERRQSGHVSLVGFYARRVRRLLPISATVLAVTAVLGAMLLPGTQLQDLSVDIRAAAAFGVNVVFARRDAAYLTAELAPSAVRQFWSLAVEEQFYVVWPTLIAVLTYRTQRIRRLGIGLVAIAVASFALSVWLTPRSPSWAYYGLHTRAWELALGAVLAMAVRRLADLSDVAMAVLGWSGLGAIVVAVASFGNVEFPGWLAAVPVFGTVAVLAAGADNRWGPAGLLSVRLLTFIGSRSYSIYLWHWPVLILAEAKLGRSLTAVEKVAAVIVTLALSEAGYRLIENPIRSSQRLRQTRRATFALGAGLIVVSLLTGTALATYRPDLATGYVAVVSDGSVAPVVELTAERDLPDNVRPDLLHARDDVPSLYANGCHGSGNTSVNRGCIFGDPTGSVTVALFGDSHAAQWFPALEELAVARHWRLLSLTESSCSFLNVVTTNSSHTIDLVECAGWRASVRAYLREQSVNSVLLSQYYFLTDADTLEVIAPDRWRSELAALVVSLRDDGIAPLVIGDTPRAPEDVPDCVARHRFDLSPCDPRDDDPTRRAIVEAVREVATKLEVPLVEPEQWLCVRHICPVVTRDILVYRDQHHLTATAARWLVPQMEAAIGVWVDASGT